MNPFYIVGEAAKEGRLPQSMDAAYYASEAFYERIRFEGRTGTGDQLAVLLFMLRHVALDPLTAINTWQHLGRGLVWLQFYGVCNPVPMLELPVGSAELGMMKEAVEVNLNCDGPLAKAAARVARRRAGLSRRHAQERQVIDRLCKSLTWPGPAEYAANRDLALEAQRTLSGILDDKRAQLRDRYRTRSAVLLRGVMPGITSWTDLMVQVTKAVFKPN
jgi:hypothetical protein